ncbi:MAG TPA: hypothetical protein VL125_06885 [Pelobium sp.]|nr:hypothetical protein [Pelobium sp.]
MTADNIRNSIIDKLLTISNKDYLYALYKIVNRSQIDDDIINLTEAQMRMLQMSEDDLENGRLISQEELDKQDVEWLKRQ